MSASSLRLLAVALELGKRTRGLDGRDDEQGVVVADVRDRLDDLDRRERRDHRADAQLHGARAQQPRERCPWSRHDGEDGGRAAAATAQPCEEPRGRGRRGRRPR